MTNTPTYKQTPIGLIPTDWEVKELGVITEREKEKYLPVKNENKKCLELEHFNQETGSINGWINSAEQKSSKNIFSKGNVLFGKLRPYLRKFWLAEFDGVCSSEVWVLKPRRNNCSSAFLFYLIQSNSFIQVANVSSGSKMPRADWDYVSSFPFPIPPLPEQQKIATILSIWDAAIDKCKEIIEKLKVRNKGLAQQLLSGNFKQKKLSEIFERVTTKNTEGNQNVITISAQRGFVMQTDFFNKVIASDILDNYFLVQKGDFCYNKSYSNGYDWGATKRLNDLDKAVVTTLYICFRLKDESKNSGDFFEYYFESGILNEGLSKVANEGGRAHGLLNVTPTDFFNIKVGIPTLEEQMKIAKILSTATTEFNQYQQKLQTLQKQKKGLMQQLLTGKVRVKVV